MVNNADNLINPIKIFECLCQTENSVRNKAQISFCTSNCYGLPIPTFTLTITSCSQCENRVHNCSDNNHILRTLWTAIIMFCCGPLTLISIQILCSYSLNRLKGSHSLRINVRLIKTHCKVPICEHLPFFLLIQIMFILYRALE